jgi:bifunctional non-homologous end joining protein LigD
LNCANTSNDDLVNDMIPPMLASPGRLPTGDGWVFEYKWDGVRAVTAVGDGAVTVWSRNRLDVTATYPELAELAVLLGGRTAVVDGEIVTLDERGHPSFPALQERMHVRSPSPALRTAVPVQYHVFDLLELDGEQIMTWPYRRRRELLAALGLDGATVRTSPVFDDGPATWTAAEAGGLEGVVAKRADAPYRPGKRSAEWVKVPFIRSQEVVIIGYQPGEGRRLGTIGALLLAVPGPDGVLHFAGGVGTGFTDAALRQLHDRLQPLRRSTPAAPDVPRDHARRAVWVEPELVGEVAYRSWTPDGRIRHGSWRGLRPDKAPAAVRRTDQPPTAAPPEPAVVTEAMQTPDGTWRIEVVRRNRSQWYRITHGDNTFDWLTIGSVQRILRDAGIDLADLTEAKPAA